MMMSGAELDRGELGRLLREARSVYDPQSVERLIEGVLAAPAEVGTGWHVLVADPITPALAGALEALRTAKAKVYHNGLSAEDFEILPRAARLAHLREELAAQGLGGFIVPRSDEHQGEYVPPRGQRLAWLTGFTGSAGVAIVLRDRAALFVDGRYTLQAAAQVDTQSFEIHHLVDEPPARWIGMALTSGAVLGYDPCCTLRKRLSGFAPRQKRPARRYASSPRILWIGSGPSSPQHRLPQSCRMTSVSPAKVRNRSASASAAA